MESFESFDPNVLLAEVEQSHKVHQEYEEMTYYLRTKLVRLGAADDLTIEDEIRLGTMASKLLLERNYSSYRLHTDKSEQTDRKKRMQARLRIEVPNPGLWLRLIDEEFPGESLAEEDYDIMQQELFSYEQNRRRDQVLFEESLEAMKQLLGTLEASELTTLVYLAAMHAHSSDKHKRLGAAQSYLVENGKNTPRWMNLVSHFFGEASQ